jgi:hypothetical protein
MHFPITLHKMIDDLIPPNIKNECYYFVKHLSSKHTFEEVLKYCGDNQRQFKGEDGSNRRLLITRFIENIKRSPKAHNVKLRNITSIDAPVFAAVHRLLEQPTIMSSDSESFVDDDSSYSETDRGMRAKRDDKRTVHFEAAGKPPKKTLDLSKDFQRLSLSARGKGEKVKAFV